MYVISGINQGHMEFQGRVQQFGKLAYCHDPHSQMSRHITFSYYQWCSEMWGGAAVNGTSESEIIKYTM